MKNSNIEPELMDQKKHKSENINALEQGIVRKLLEKYKSKYIYNMKTVSDKNNQKRWA